MSVTWRIKVYDETFVSRTQPGAGDNILTPAFALASLDRFDVDGAGNCLEASFQAVPSLVDIQPRDIVILEVSTNGGSSWTQVYRGYIVTCGNPRSTSVEAYKAVGLKQRFFEKLNPLNTVDGDDVATMVTDVFNELVSESDVPSGVTTSPIDAPLLTFELGDRFPQLETVGETFDAFLETVASFIVPSGTYVYDGVTYAADDTVPAAQWGVRADGEFFFARPQATSVAVAEGDTNVLTRYNEIAAEDVVDDVVLLYATQYESTAFGDPQLFNIILSPPALKVVNLIEEPVVPMARRFSFGGDGATITNVVQPFERLMRDVAATTTTTGTVSNAGNVRDGDDSTFATITDGSITVDVPGFFIGSIPSFEDGLIARVKIEAIDPDNYVLMTSGQVIRYRLDDIPDGDFVEGYVPFLVPLRYVIAGDIDYLTIAGKNIRVYTVELLIPDSELVNGGESAVYARSFVRQPSLDVAEVTQYGTLGAVTQTMSFTPDGESARDVPIERIEYALTTGEGLSTTYYLAQAYDAELLSERAVLEALARRATR